jgi:hypothetical protein
LSIKTRRIKMKIELNQEYLCPSVTNEKVKVVFSVAGDVSRHLAVYKSSGTMSGWTSYWVREDDLKPLPYTEELACADMGLISDEYGYDTGDAIPILKKFLETNGFRKLAVKL